VAWDVIYYAAQNGSVPAVEFLAGCPTKVAANLLAVLDAVAEAPPPQYSGGGKWEALCGASAPTTVRTVPAESRAESSAEQRRS
jgi:hypothetical protein